MGKASRRKQERRHADSVEHHDRIAQVVHRAICEEVGTEEPERGLCWLYNAVGCLLASEVSGRDYFLQAGMLALHPDPDDEDTWFAFDVEDDGFQRGEFHAWFVRIEGMTAGSGRVEDPTGGRRMEIVDLAARQWPRWITDNGRRWARPVLPYLWTRLSELPAWIKFLPDERATTLANQPTRAQSAQAGRVYGRAQQLWSVANR